MFILYIYLTQTYTVYNSIPKMRYWAVFTIYQEEAQYTIIKLKQKNDLEILTKHEQVRDKKRACDISLSS